MVVYNVLKSKFETDLAFFLARILFSLQLEKNFAQQLCYENFLQC